MLRFILYILLHLIVHKDVHVYSEPVIFIRMFSSSALKGESIFLQHYGDSFSVRVCACSSCILTHIEFHLVHIKNKKTEQVSSIYFVKKIYQV